MSTVTVRESNALLGPSLVNRRIEQRQEHSVTRTEITQRYLTPDEHLSPSSVQLAV